MSVGLQKKKVDQDPNPHLVCSKTVPGSGQGSVLKRIIILSFSFLFRFFLAKLGLRRRIYITPMKRAFMGEK
jgi:hypothetical protein